MGGHVAWFVGLGWAVLRGGACGVENAGYGWRCAMEAGRADLRSHGGVMDRVGGR